MIALMHELVAKKKVHYEKEKQINKGIVQKMEQENKELQQKEAAQKENKISQPEKFDLKETVFEFVFGNLRKIQNEIKLFPLLVLEKISELCCKRRLPSQFYKLD